MLLEVQHAVHAHDVEVPALALLVRGREDPPSSAARQVGADRGHEKQHAPGDNAPPRDDAYARGKQGMAFGAGGREGPEEPVDARAALGAAVPAVVGVGELGVARGRNEVAESRVGELELAGGTVREGYEGCGLLEGGRRADGGPRGGVVELVGGGRRRAWCRRRGRRRAPLLHAWAWVRVRCGGAGALRHDGGRQQREREVLQPFTY